MGDSPSSSLFAQIHPVAPSHSAPSRHLPQQAFASIEYPGPVSHPSAILNLVSQDDINECFNAPITEGNILEMSYRPGDRSCVPVRGNKVPSQKLLLKIVKRHRRKEEEGHVSRRRGKEREGAEEGVFTAEIVGPVNQTVRFRSMADWHYTPDPNGRVSQVYDILRDLNYDAILDYKIPPLDETYLELVEPAGGSSSSMPTYRSLLDLQPPPTFSERRLPPAFGFKQPPQVGVEDWEDEKTGQIRKRYVNKARYVALGTESISHVHKPEEVPTGPPAKVKTRMAKLDLQVLKKLKELFDERPVWTRAALLAQLNIEETTKVNREKAYLSSVAYTFGTGPYWKCLVRYGYDPVAIPEARMYQRIWFYVSPARSRGMHRDEAEEEAEGQVGAQTKQEWEAEQLELIEQGKRPPIDRTRPHIFDGQVLNRHRPDYQLCDIEDPLIRRYINKQSAWMDKCDPRDGWYATQTMDIIKALVRHKFIRIRKTGLSPSAAECAEIIVKIETSGTKEL
ncbi:hypothetical protein TREMEDRAFT_68676 [Tremella mesenterica DSM 1558]|uniref:uncharacterized protein n=1 Tax=Tremella mesenterica (strain ATCC 24925 / CBS 8224 / DSM 1558 / NBRC 9311 / NRRL Y-6157 / RJB 2259-6 / UBC 559-6) TaxID=578456 RepID=UPI0003F494BF|nr:uncharacterized protein TREMEDRAFT_68676 [Tremella mesenterica DSM 1558]EIW69414.1 hypothetical protein TREMEDRAFT_68676 [Tremella mesenterica DSM 1558]